MREQQSRLDELKIKAKIVAFDNDFMAKAYAESSQLVWPILLDTDRKLYAAYGMARGSWWAIYNPFSIIKYLSLIVRGRRPGRPGKDWRQLGGNVLIDPNGVVRLHHISKTPHDRPTLDDIFHKVSEFGSNID